MSDIILICSEKPETYIFDKIVKSLWFDMCKLNINCCIIPINDLINPKYKKQLWILHTQSYYYLKNNKLLDKTPKNYILIQYEPLDLLMDNHRFLEFIKNAKEVWTHSNGKEYDLIKTSLNKNIRFLPQGYCEYLDIKYQLFLNKGDRVNIDFLFYGQKNERRRNVFNKLKMMKYKVYNKRYLTDGERMNLLSRSKIVPIIHRDDYEVFDFARASPLISIRFFFICETPKDKKTLDLLPKELVHGDYKDIHNLCKKYIDDKTERNIISDSIYKYFKENISYEVYIKKYDLFSDYKTFNKNNLIQYPYDIFGFVIDGNIDISYDGIIFNSNGKLRLNIQCFDPVYLYYINYSSERHKFIFSCNNCDKVTWKIDGDFLYVEYNDYDHYKNIKLCNLVLSI